MLGSSQQAIAQPTGWHGLGWDLPPLQASRSVGGATGKFSPPPAAPPPSAPVTTAAWPAGTAQVDLPATAKGVGSPVAPAGKLPVAVGRSDSAERRPGKVEVETLDHGSAEKAGIPGTLIRLAPVTGDTGGPITVHLDYRGFASAFGADFGRRLRFQQYPACVLSTPDRPECRTATPVESANSPKDGQLTGTVTLNTTTMTVLAATAGTSGGGGDFTATNLSPAGTWTAGGSGGDFSYSYPIAAPPAAGAKAPSLALSYSSSSVDGRTSATNNQASAIGDGWEIGGGGFIERSYKSCAQDLGGNNGQTKSGDLCWFSDNATMSLGGSNVQLVKDTASGAWHPKSDNGSRVEKLIGAANGAQGGEYWKVTTADGTQYFFGLNHLPGWQSGNPETQSAWTEPVFGNNSGEPCNAATFAASWCQQAWRWNLDYVVDPHGNAISYYYQSETNNYGLNLNTTSAGTPYVRGGYLTRIEYGFNTGVANVYSHAPAQILFDTTERCLPGGTITCDPAQLNSGTASSWPDVPADQICAPGATCTNVAPSFFSRRRVIGITTQVTDGGSGWNTVDTWALAQSFPASGDGSSPAMWLDSVTRTGKVGGSISLPPTTFHPKALANRVDTSSMYTAITRNRIDAITNEQGGVTTVKYADPQCVAGSNMPANPESNTMACFPSYWTPGGATDPVLDWFNLYPVTDITDDGRTTLSQQVLTHYDYVGGGAWHHDDNPLVDPKYRTWSQWRGYATVRTTKGQATSDPAGPPVVTQTLYLRGMDGDTLPGGGTRSVSVTDSLGESIPDGKALAGFTRESTSYLNGQVIGTTINDPWVSAATATDASGAQSFFTNTGTSRTRTWIAATNQWLTTRKGATFGAYGLVVTSEDDGDVTDPNQASCTRTTYAQNTGAWLLSLPSQVQKTAGTCDQAPASGTIIADHRFYYDHQAFGAAPTIGDVTQTDELDAWPSGGAEQFTSPATTAGYDSYGRLVSSTTALGLTTTTAYTPATGGPVTRVDVTTPPISGTDTTTLTSTKYLDPVSGAVTAEVDNSGLRTDATYDALGRLTAVWRPGHSKSANAQPDATVAYTVNNNGPSVITSSALLSSGQYAASYSLVDGLGRTVQKQSPTPYAQGGRLVADTFFDSQGRAWKTHDSYWNGDSGPGTTLLVVQDNAVPSTTVTAFDTAGRKIASIYQLYGTEQWRTTTVYDGDRTTTIPPHGGTAKTVITNGLGQKIKSLDYKDPAHTGTGDPADATTYTYTHSGKPASVTDPTGSNTWTMGYDLHGRKVVSADPDTGTSHFAYDADGRLLTSTDGRGRTLAYTYDNLGRKTAEFDGSTSSTKLVSWTYDTLMKGKVTSSSRYANGKTYTNAVTGYDDAGRSQGTKVTIPLTETGLGGNYQFSTNYDALTGAVHSFTSPAKGGLANETMVWLYDTLGNPSQLYTADSNGGGTHLVSETDYNPYGQVLRTNYQDPNDPNQIAVTSTYEDGTNRLTGTLAERATTTNYAIANRAYTYDQSGQMTKVADTPQGDSADVQCYNYDYLQRLAQAWTPASADCGAAPTAAGLGGAAPYWTSWTFDQIGNRLTQVQHASTGDTTSTSTYPQAGQPQPHAATTSTTANAQGSTQVAYTYDAAGNSLTGGPAGNGQTFTYDTEGHIATATDASGKVSSYTYDADGNRFLTKDPSGTTLTIGDLEIFVAAGTSTSVATRTYTYNGHAIAERNGNTGLAWLMTDTQGTPYASVNASNLAVTKRWQDPYGAARGPAPTGWPDKHGFLNGYQNTTGLIHLGAREYDPTTGRFITVDPLLNVGDTQQMNGYSYASGNPVTFSDPSGLCRGPDGLCPLPGGGWGGPPGCHTWNWGCDPGANNPKPSNASNASNTGGLVSFYGELLNTTPLNDPEHLLLASHHSFDESPSVKRSNGVFDFLAGYFSGGMPMVEFLCSQLTHADRECNQGGSLAKQYLTLRATSDSTSFKIGTIIPEVIQFVAAIAQPEIGAEEAAANSVPKMASTFGGRDSAIKNMIKYSERNPMEGFLDVIGHGGPDDIAGQSAAEIAAKIGPGLAGRNVRLLSCWTACPSGSFAQDLANILRVRVLAPTTEIGASGTGKTLTFFDGGEWRSFDPN
ncbi:RHS repeat-associated core domain-containing protein [Amycolatopsis rhizosphaerae]|nr:RHS repeat-associated core domain-containing protein [Amycolatopsis rhizosphaerae]